MSKGFASFGHACAEPGKGFGSEHSRAAIEYFVFLNGHVPQALTLE